MQRPSHKTNDPTIKSTHAYSLAHTARCKLHMSAKDPDRNLRFMLGHAFLLDKALYRVAQIEEDDDDEPEDEEQKQLKPQVSDAMRDEDDEGGLGRGKVMEAESGSLAGGKVKINSGDETKVDVQEIEPEPDTRRQAEADDGERTPPDDGPDDFDFDEGDDDGGLGLTRFASASGKPPRMIPDEGDEDEEEADEAISPPALPADFDLGTIVAGPESEDVSDLYERVRGCPCHGLGEKAEKGKRFWEVKNEMERPGKRIAIMQVEA